MAAPSKKKIKSQPKSSNDFPSELTESTKTFHNNLVAVAEKVKPLIESDVTKVLEAVSLFL